MEISSNISFVWCDVYEEAFKKQKEKLCCELLGYMYDSVAKFTPVHTDASSVALSGMLLQEEDAKNLHLVYAVSKWSTDVEDKYHSSRLELYAMIWILSRLRSYMLDIKLTLVTDCRASIFLNLHKTTKPQIARWYELL